MKKLFLVLALASVTTGVMAEEVIEPGMTHECGYSPEGTALPVVLKAINEVSGPRGSILIAAYEFTSKPIAAALIEAKRRGAEVAVVADTTENRKPYSQVVALTKAGIPVRFDNQLQMLHDKFMVLNGTTVETGSFNYTGAAASNRHAENACVFRHAPQLADDFSRSWKQLWDESESVL